MANSITQRLDALERARLEGAGKSRDPKAAFVTRAQLDEALDALRAELAPAAAKQGDPKGKGK